MTGTRILIVEDDPASRDILARLLVHHQIDVDQAANAEEALEMLEQSEYALAVIDLALPGMDGWRLLQAMRANPATAALEAVAITAFYEPALVGQAKEAGFLTCYPKPPTSAFIKELQKIIGA